MSSSPMTPAVLGLTEAAEQALWGRRHCSAPSCRCLTPCAGVSICAECDGYGALTCPECEGTHVVECSACDGTGHGACYACDGTGEVDGLPCVDCDGSGRDPDDPCLVCDEGLAPCGACGEPEDGLVTCGYCHGRGVVS